MNAQTSSVAPTLKSYPVSLRMQPKLHYLLLLAARCEDRSISNYIEQAIKEKLQVDGSPHLLNDGLYDPCPAIRLLLLATAKPELLTDGEQALWHRICADKDVMSGSGVIDRAKLSAKWNQLISKGA